MKRLWILLIPLLFAPLVALSLLTWWLAGRVQDELLVARRKQHAEMLHDFEHGFARQFEQVSEPVKGWGQKVLADANAEPPVIGASWYLVVDAAGRWRYPKVFSTDYSIAESLPGEKSAGLLDDFSQALSYERLNASVGIAAEKYQDIANREGTPATARARALLGLARCQQKLSNPAQAAKVYQQIVKDYAELRDETGTNYAAEASAALVKLAADQQESTVAPWRAHVDALLADRYPMSAVLALGHLADVLANWPAEAHESADQERHERLEQKVQQLRQMDEAAARLLSGQGGQFPAHLESRPQHVLLVQPVTAASERGWAVAAFQPDYLRDQLARGLAQFGDADRGLIGVRDEHGVTVVGTELAPEAISVQGSMSRWGLPWMIEIGLSDLSAVQRQGRQRHLLLTGSIAVLLVLIVTGVALGWHLMRRELELSKLKSDFVDNVSHELRTPVTSIKMFSEMLQSGQIADPSRQQEYYRLLASESGRLARMIENVLNFSRIMAGRMRLNRRSVDIASFLTEQQDVLELQARTTGHRLHLHLGRDLPVCSIDPEAISRVLANLVSNAAKYSDKDQPVTITAQRRDGLLSIMVRDRGMGIPPQDLSRVFERFYRASSPNGEHIQGTGLGLTIVKDTVERHGGTVRIESRVGEGTVVELLLPV